MPAKKLMPATLLGFLAMFVLAAAWHKIMQSFYYNGHGLAGPNYRTEPLVIYIILGYLLLAFLMAYIYPKGVEGTGKMANGLRFGALMGLLFTLPNGLALYGATTASSIKLVMIDAAWHVIEQGIGGAVIAMVYGTEPFATDETK